jgi:hypothetical protein
MISQSGQPVTENYRTEPKRATRMTIGTPVTLNVTNFQSVWMQRHKERRMHDVWGKMLQINTTGNVTGHGMHAQFSSLSAIYSRCFFLNNQIFTRNTNTTIYIYIYIYMEYVNICKYMKYVNGRRTGLVTFCVETAFYNGLLKEIYKGVYK